MHKYPDAFQFIKEVPVNWDDTKIIAAEPGDYVVIARKPKDREDWFIGGIKDENEQTITIDCDFLAKPKIYRHYLPGCRQCRMAPGLKHIPLNRK